MINPYFWGCLGSKKREINEEISEFNISGCDITGGLLKKKGQNGRFGGAKSKEKNWPK